MDTPQEEGSAPQDSQDTPAASEQPEYFDEKFDPASLPPELQPGYQQMRNAFHQKTQALAEQRRSLQAPESLASMFMGMSPEERDAFFEASNLEYEQPDEDYDDEDYDDEEPQEFRDPRFDVYLAHQEQLAQQAQVEEWREQQLDVVNDGIDALEERTGRDLSQHEIDVIGDLAMTMLDDNGLPQVDEAYERFVQAEQGRRAGNAGPKRNLRQPGQGLPGDEKVDMTEPDARRRALAAEIEAAQADEV